MSIGNTMNMSEMKVLKRNNTLEEVSFDKILNRVKIIGKEFNVNINYSLLVMKVIDQLYNGIPTKKIDELTAEQCAAMSTQNPDYGTLASTIVVSNHQKSTPSNFREVVEKLYNFKDVNGVDVPLVSKELYDVTMKYQDEIENIIDYKRDYLIDYFGFKTLERAYLFRVNKVIVERPQHMWMRVSIGIHGDNLEKVKETYDLMSQKYFTHATPTLYNAGTPRPQLSSCYLLAMENDSIDGIYNTVKDCAKISKWAGGIGLHIHNVRGTGSHIRGTNGTSNGIVPMLRVFNMTARYVDQCVTPETIIYTTQGPIEIQNCSFGETQIYNLKGDIETIENVLEHTYEGEMLTIETMHSIDDLKITPEHPVLVLANQPKGTNFNLIKNRLDKSVSKLQWIEAKELTQDDMIVYKIPSYSRDIKNISDDDCYMYGVILGDGYMENKGSDGNYGYISLHSTNKSHILDFSKRYFENKCINYRIKQLSKNNTIIYWTKSLVLPFRHSDIYDMNGVKHVHHKWLNLPVEKCKFILKGLLDTDGCKKNELVFNSISRNLIESARFICMKMGILTSGYIRDRIGESHKTSRGTITNKKNSYCLRIPKTKDICDLMNIEYNDNQFFKFFRYNDFLFTRIKNIKSEQYSGTLYDLQMKDEHNYMIHNGIIHNGGGKRNGSFAIYLEPWHTDIVEFLELRKNHGEEEMRCRDLFLALWTPDLFMERVKTDGNWSLFCPDQCPGLSDSYGDDFKELYTKYESEGKAVKTMKARSLWFKILDAQMETGTPYILFKDAANKKSNQKNLGVIKSSNLCTEIMEYSSSEETAVCNLASIALTKFVGPVNKKIKQAKIYTKTTCRYCIKSKNLLKLNNILYDEINLDDDNERIAFYEELSSKLGANVKTVPQIYIDDHYVGCYDDLVEYLKPVFHYDDLHHVTKVVTENLNKVINVNYYPTEKTLKSNMRHRPIGLGVQGLADAFFKLDIPFHSQEAAQINKDIFETIYHAALEKSMELSIERREKLGPLYDYFNNYTPVSKAALEIIRNGQVYNSDLKFDDENINQLYHSLKPIANELFEKTNHINSSVVCRPENLIGSYSSFIGSPASNGILQFDMWNAEPSGRYDWNDLKHKIKINGIRNSLLVAPMPTASTSQILGNNECFEPVTSNIYSRRTIAGEFVMVNKYLMYDLINLGEWNEDVKNNIIANQGSVQQLPFLSQHLKDKYKIVWEMPMKHLIDMSRDRGAFVCQSQSLNLWVEDPDYKTLTSMHFYSHQAGLKTGIYYLRRKPKHTPQQFTIVPDKKEIVEEEYEICEMCSG
jgi:ribonucleotide reductase alpha subunit/intein/homing endonuclease